MECVACKAGITGIAACRVDVQAGFVSLKDTVKSIDPCISIIEDSGIPVGKPAILNPDPIGGGKADAGAVSGKMDTGKLTDPALIGNCGTQLDPCGERGLLSVFLRTNEMEGTAPKNNRLCIGNGGQCDVDCIFAV